MLDRIVIAGASGFLGAACVKALRNSAAIELITVDRCGDVDFCGDLADASFVNSLPDADVIINCAAVQYINKQPWFRKNWFRRNNISTAKNLVDRFSESRIIHVSTSMVYDQTVPGPYAESALLKSQGLYSESKLCAEQIICKTENHAIVVPCIIGGQGRGGLFVSFVKSIRLFRSVLLVGEANLKTSMVHVDDVAALIKIILETRGVGRFNAAADDELTISEWADEVGHHLGVVGHPVKLYLPMSLMAFISKISMWRLLAKEQVSMLRRPHVLVCHRSKEIGWSPKFSTKEIIYAICDGITGKL